jgi:hypothetical protein
MVKRYKSTVTDYASSVLGDSSGNVYVTGTSIGNKTGNDYVTVKYDANGKRTMGKKVQ